MVNWATVAFTFPGQGSQTVGMGRTLAEAYPAARRTFDEADDVLRFSLSSLCFNGPEDDLNDTYNTQPALYTAGVAALRALQAERPDAVPGFVAGHSLGEFTALAAAGVLSFADGLLIVRERGRLMRRAGEEQPGGMAAVLGLDADAVRAVCAQASSETGSVLVLANDNCPGQVVVSGQEAALGRGAELLQAAGAKRVVRLAVSIAAHSPLMTSAQQDFAAVLSEFPFSAPQVPVVGNVTAAPLQTTAAIAEELRQQLTSPVRWTESVRALVAGGVEHFIELGPKDVLTGLLKRIDRERRGTPLGEADAVAAFARAL